MIGPYELRVRQFSGNKVFTCEEWKLGDHGLTMWGVAKPTIEKLVFLPYHAIFRIDLIAS